jgi:hypothetical protein
MAADRFRNENWISARDAAPARPRDGRLLLAIVASLIFGATLFVLLPTRSSPFTSRWPGPQASVAGAAPTEPARPAPTPGAADAPASQPIAGVAAPVPQRNQGLQYGAVVDDAGNRLLTDEALGLMAQSGAGWIKINFRLGGFANWTETDTFGYSALSVYDRIVADAQRHHLKVLGGLSNEAWHGIAPHWQGNSVEAAGGDGVNRYIEDFAEQAAGRLIEHYAGNIDVWEVWNEPSQPNTFMYPSNFAQLLARVYATAKARGVTNSRLVSGGITSLQDVKGNFTAASSGADYLREVYAQGRRIAGWDAIKAQYGSYPLDGIGQHIYLDEFGTAASANIRAALELLRAAYVDGEGGSTPKQTFITEFGWTTNNLAEQTQADNLQTAYSTFKEISFVAQAYWFFLRDEPGPGLFFGLLRADSSEKPAWNAYRTFANY